ncbi:aspartic proteinase 36 [Ziziphus jujuba]|uniref:Aspartic proteinase 36 n=1 Tax=Ziziphus jujuba TaxID=326968 RepID=A0ABM3IB36_ZIZJJ|nr:aspartic proteinase 36 [Ziziphus jujuba]
MKMDLGTRLALLGGILVLALFSTVSGNFVFPVQHKFKGRERSLRTLKDHDMRRHGRILSSVDLQLGGNSMPTDIGLYFAKLRIGSPSKDYYVQVDTGSDILWVNCIDCQRCPTKSDLGIDLTLYDPKSSSTSKLITCDQEFCTSTYDGPLPGCRPELLCQYNVVYGDGSTTTGYFVKDTIHFDRLIGNQQTQSENGSVIFGCGSKQSGDLGKTSEALDGLIGFGQANSSMISQLAVAGKVKKTFAHCLDNVNGGGIFAIGEVVQPQVNTTPMVPNQAHYNVYMKAIEVGGDVLELPTDIFDTGDRSGTIIDSGTTLAYLPDTVYDPLVTKVLAQQPGLKLHTVDDEFTCFEYNDKVDDGFPVITLHFDKSLILTVYPHDYLFQIRDRVWCIGWQNSGVKSKDGKEVTLLGDMVLANKLVVYDAENQVIGWREYNCSSTIKLKDESGSVYTVGHHNLSSGDSLGTARVLTILLLLGAVLHNFVQNPLILL